MYFALKVRVVGPDGLLMEDRICYNMQEGIHMMLPPCFDAWISKVDPETEHLTMFLQNRTENRPNYFSQIDIPKGKAVVINAKSSPINFQLQIKVHEIYEELKVV